MYFYEYVVITYNITYMYVSICIVYCFSVVYRSSPILSGEEGSPMHGIDDDLLDS